MENAVEAHIEFSFKGETYSSSLTVDLDDLMQRGGALPSMHAVLAEKMGIDTYSYLYEVMLESEITFENARGVAAGFVTDGEFDFHAFMAAWQENTVLGRLQSIAAREMGVAKLGEHPALQNALLQAYHLGKGI